MRSPRYRAEARALRQEGGRSALHESGGAGRARVARILAVQPPGRGPRVAKGLSKLPGHTTVEIVHDAGSCLSRCAGGGVDALVRGAGGRLAGRRAERCVDPGLVTG